MKSLLENKQNLKTHYQSIVAAYSASDSDNGFITQTNELFSFDEVHEILENWTEQFADFPRKTNMSSKKKQELLIGSEDKGLLYLQQFSSKETARLLAEHPQKDILSLHEAKKMYDDGKYGEWKHAGWKKWLKRRENMLYTELLYLAVYLRMKPEDRKILGGRKFPGRNIYAPTIRTIKNAISYLEQVKDTLEAENKMYIIHGTLNPHLQNAIDDHTSLLKEYEAPLQGYPKRVTDKTVIVWSANVINQYLYDLEYSLLKNRQELIQIFCKLCGYEVKIEAIKKWLQRTNGKGKQKP